MKRLAFAMGLVAAAMFAAPLAAQSSQGPWWDPANTGNRGTVDTRNGTIYNGSGVYDSRRADGQWRRTGTDRNGNYVYTRTRYDSNGNLVRESARRDTRGRYQVFDRRIVQSANSRNGRYDRNGDYDNDRNNDGYEDNGNGYGRRKNDRWEQNGGHDNGKHNGQYKNRNNGRNHD